MRVALLSAPPDLSGYIGEILRTWGLPLFDRKRTDGQLSAVEHPVAIVPAGVALEADSLRTYCEAGGTAIVACPSQEVARAFGLRIDGERDEVLRLVASDVRVAGLSGEALPLVGPCLSLAAPETARVRAWLMPPKRFGADTPAIVEVSVGRGRLLALAFDLPLSVLMLRQGDPARAEQLPDNDPCARPAHLACDVDAGEAGWLPFADLLARLLVDLVIESLPGPAPTLWHLPEAGAGILLYSGDEDHAQVAWNDEEMAAVTDAGGRMSLYIIPGKTHSTKADGERYRRHHDLGPHPDIRPLDGRPVRERLDELERQIVQFERDFGVQARTIRQHCTAWAGYLEPVEVMARLGVRMEGNYFSGGYSRWRDPAPYAPFGGAMPMRFCWPDGRLIDVYQQHTQISDDIHFGAYEYSYYIAPGAYSDMVRRILGDVCTRLHTPYAVCMHPSNWVRFSGDQGREQLRQAGERGLPIWSFDQWLDWWEARATRELTARWGDGVLRFEVAADTPCVGLRLMLPREFDGRRLGEVQVAGAPASTGAVTRWGRELVWVEVPAADGFAGTATYG